MSICISIDIRKINDSGIGTSISNLVPLVIRKMPETQFYLLGDVSKLSEVEWCCADNVELVQISSKPFSLQEQSELLSKIPDQTDLLWCTQINIPVLYRKKMLVTVYDILQIALPQFSGNWLGRSYIKLLLNIIKRKSLPITAISSFTKNELVNLMGFNPDRIEAIPLGTPPQWFTIIKDKNPQERPYLLFVGNLKPHKNITRIIEAFQLIQERVDCDLVIVGTASGFKTKDNQLLDRISTFGDRIKFTGYIDDEKLGQYFAHAEALVFPSLYEGFGLPALEAMACGCPVIASNLASLPEVCGDAALYCDPYSSQEIADRMLQILQDKQLRDDLIERGHRRSLEFTYEICAERTVKLIKRLL